MPAELHLWLKALHIVAITAWFAGLFYLPRLFVYHCGSNPESAQSDTFKIMERRLLWIIMNPAMIISWLLGLALVASLGSEYLKDAWWLWLKLCFVVALSVYHMLLAGHVRKFAANANVHGARYFRILNEVPTLVLIVVVVLAVVKPF